MPVFPYLAPSFSYMDFSIIILLIFLAFRNGMRAREKGVSAPLWGFLTVVFFSMGLFIGFFISFLAIFRGQFNMIRMQRDQAKYSQELAMQFSQALLNNPVHSFAIMMCGLGGYLLVRYILNKKQDIENIKLQ